MCFLTFCALGDTLLDRGHIRMTFLLKVVRGRPRIYLDLTCFVVGLAFCALLTWYTGAFFLDSVVSRSQSMQISETYLAIPQFFMPLGALIMTLQFLGEILAGFGLVWWIRRRHPVPADEQPEGEGDGEAEAAEGEKESGGVVEV